MDLDSLDIARAQIGAAITLYGGKIALALVAFIIGRIIIGKISSVVSKTMNRRKWTPTFSHF
jgi:small conductance mechanosensitive channel